MTETSSTNGFDWNQQWQQVQRAYWDSLRSLLQVNGGEAAANPAANPWTQMTQNWWNAMSAGMKGDHHDVFARMLEQGRAMFGMGQQMSDLFRAVADSTMAGTNWQETLKQRFDDMKGTLSSDQTAAWTDHIKHMWAFMEMPLDTWRRMCSGSSVMPGDCMQAFRTQVLEGVGDKLHGEMDKFLSVPGVGYTREGQEQLQQLGRLMLDYQKASQDYLNAHTKLGADALDRLYRKIIALTEKGEKVTSLRQLYDLWVDASEEVYGSFAMSPTFRDLYGRMVNALMRVKGQLRTMVDEVLGALNMPTRREMNTILKRQHELKREMRNLARGGGDGTSPPRGRRGTADGDSAEIRALRGEVAALREQISAMQAALKAKTVQKTEPVMVPLAETTSSPARATRASAPKAASKPETDSRPAARKARGGAANSRKAQKPANWDIGSIVSGADEPASNVTPIRPNRRAGK
jgi:class III poly(R)-hydroxyalkanoic acid synthase PhaE subunit